MPKEIWNEGRVTGLSAYEIYVKQHLVEDPANPPATEREWLSASIAMGSSMLLKVPEVGDEHTKSKDHTYVDIPLPADTKLAAANTIIAQFFDGDGLFKNASPWASRVVDYGQLISNKNTSSPDGEIDSEHIHDSIPIQAPLSEMSDDAKAKLKNYMKIIDGLVLQPGTWRESGAKPPEKDFQANLGSVYPTIRLHVRGKIDDNHRPLILLTGFTLQTVLAGVVGQDSVLESGSPQDGDFLGPAVFPWAAKIVFSVPNSYISYFESNTYERKLKTPTAEAEESTQKIIQDTPVIDMQASKPETFYADYADYRSYYTSKPVNPWYTYQVNDFSTLGDTPTDGAAVLTVFQKKSIYPPALYGSFVNATGQNHLNPLDIVAPGSIKMFNNQSEEVLQDYQDTFPGTTSMNKTSDGKIQIINNNGDLVDVASQSNEYLTNATVDGDPVFKAPDEHQTQTNGFLVLSGDARPRVVKITTGNVESLALMMSKGVGESQREIHAKPTKTEILLNHHNSNDNLCWASFIHALHSNKPIDLLGNNLKQLKYTLVKPVNSVPDAEDTPEAEKKYDDTNMYDSTKGSSYVEYGVGNSKTLRLYISSTPPSTYNVPEGSIGIGWGFAPSNNS